jgi:hypothetical protein
MSLISKPASFAYLLHSLRLSLLSSLLFASLLSPLLFASLLCPLLFAYLFTPRFSLFSPSFPFASLLFLFIL